MAFIDRRDAGRRLADRLGELRGAGVVVVGLPRGGVPVAAEVAAALAAPLDVCLVRKLGVPFAPELAMGAIGEDGARVVDDETVRAAGVTPSALAEVEQRERAALVRMAARYRGVAVRVDVRGRTVVVVDDGLATGATARVACQAMRARGAGRVVLAVPVAPADWASTMGAFADELVCVQAPRRLEAISLHYADFAAVSEQEVVDCLRRAAEGPPSAAAGREG